MKDLEELKKLQKTLNELENLRKQPGIPTEPLDRAMDALRVQIKGLEATQHIEIDGDVGAGSIVGDGTIIAEKISSDSYFYFQSPEIGSPMQRVEDDYLRAMVEMHSRLSLDPLDQGESEFDQKSPELKNIYISLNVIETIPVEGNIVAKGENRPLSAIEAIATHTHVVLLGGPGTGKSTILKYLTWSLATLRRMSSGPTDLATKPLQEWPGKPVLPILISLTKLAQWLARHEQPILENYVNDMLMRLDLQDSAQHIRMLIRRSDVILLLDGLDEVTNQDSCKKVIKVLDDFVDRHPDIHMAVTCRTLSYTNPELHLKRFTTQTLAPLVNEQIHFFIQNWYEQLVQRKQILRSEALKRAKYLEQMVISRLSELSTVPLLLTVILIIYERTGDLPHEKARLYYRCCEVLMWHWQKAKLDLEGKLQLGISERLETPEHLLMTALMRLAYEQYEQQRSAEGSPDIQETVVLSTFRPYFQIDRQADRPETWKKAALFLEYIQDRAGLLVAQGSTGNDTTYTFVHRTFQEFLAARYLTTQGNFADKVIQLFYNDESDRWHEVVLLAIGHLVFNQSSFATAIETAEKLVETQGVSEQQKWRAIWWAAEILAIVGPIAVELDSKGEKLLSVVRSELATVVNNGKLPPRQRATAGEALARIGDPRQGVMESPPLCIPIPQGRFMIGAKDDDSFSSTTEHPSCSVVLASFEISIHPVTNAQYRLFIEDDGYTKKHLDCWTPQGWLWKEENQWTRSESIDDPTLGIDNKPVVGVSWFEAIAYTRWLSKSHATCYRLPTEAEWERVARGIHGFIYPWGDSWLDEAANTKELGLDGPTSVGIFPLSTSFGACTDLVGNVWEWCQSLYKEYPYVANDGRENLDSPGPRVARGGSYHNTYTLARCTYRLWRFPGFRNSYIGFRVVKGLDRTG